MLPTSSLNGDIRHAAEELFAMDVFTLRGETILIIHVHFRAKNATSSKMLIQRILKHVENEDVVEIHQLAYFCSLQQHGLQRDMEKALDLYLKAGKLGYCYSHGAIADLHLERNGVPLDRKKAIFYYQQAALGGHEVARHNLGLYESDGSISGKPNMKRAVKHWMVSASSGLDESVTTIRESYQRGFATATKADFEKALLANREAKDEMKSEQREAALRATGSVSYLSPPGRTGYLYGCQ